MKLAVGDLLSIDRGEWSDFGVIGVFRASKEFESSEVLEMYLSANPIQRENYRFEEYGFVGWLSSHGYISEVDYFDWHIGAYSCVDRADEPTKHDREMFDLLTKKITAA